MSCAQAIGTNLVLKFRDEEQFEWADLAKSLWPTPLPKVEDLSATSSELLKFYTEAPLSARVPGSRPPPDFQPRPCLEAYDDAVPFLEEVRQAGLRPDGTSLYELEVQALERLVGELEAKIEEMERKIEEEKEAERARKRAEKRAEQGLPPDADLEGEEEPLSPKGTGEDGVSVELKEL